jgi:hypothetical protein
VETYYRLPPPGEDPEKLLDPDHGISEPWDGAIYGTCDKRVVRSEQPYHGKVRELQAQLPSG